MARSQMSKKLIDILSILSDEDCLRLLESVIVKKTTRISDFESPRRYYTRLALLKKASLITKIGKAYKITTLGTILYDVLQIAETAQSFSWELKVLDAIDGTIPIGEKHVIIKKLIPDESIQKILLAKC